MKRNDFYFGISFLLFWYCMIRIEEIRVQWYGFELSYLFEGYPILSIALIISTIMMFYNLYKIITPSFKKQ